MSKPIEPCYRLFGAKVQQVREVMEMTQAELAKRTGLQRTSIVNIEAGRQRVLLHDIDRFSKALGIPAKAFTKSIWGT